MRILSGENLRLILASAVATQIFAKARVRYDNGKSGDLQILEKTTGASRAVESYNSQEVAIDDGTIESAIVFVRTVAVEPGQLYASLYLAAGEDLKGAICKGYVYDGHDVSLGEFEVPGSGRGWEREITGADPAAGAECSDSVPSGALWALKAYQVVLVAAAVAITRTPNLFAATLTTVVLKMYRAGGGTLTTGQTETMSWIFDNGADVDAAAVAIGAVTYNIATSVHRPLLKAGDSVATITTNLQGADDYGAPILLVEEWVVV